MKVLDLECGQHHVFEGWFGSEDIYQEQSELGLIECPYCGDSSVSKKLCAPRLNLGASAHSASLPRQAQASSVVEDGSLQDAWMALARQIIARTDDVGNQFAEEARKIHYGEIKERGIRGKATREETESLIEEGINVLPLSLPQALKKPMQ